VQLRDRAEAVSRLYRRLDLHVRSFRSFSGLECLPGCGRCCLSPEVEATVLEMLPAAFQLGRQGRIEQSLVLLEAPPPPLTCLLYVPEPQPPALGHCSLYERRALLCRLFGFAATLDRDGHRELATCGRIRATHLGLAAQADEAVRHGTAMVPVISNYRMALYGIDPSLGSRPLPINVAIAEALHMVGLDSRHWRLSCRRRRAG
jgi:Fe-S-cluster containining protein